MSGYSADIYLSLITMRLASLLASILLSTCTLHTNAASAQAVFASNAAYTTGDSGETPHPTEAAKEKIVLAGKITNPAGPLPGAVVILTATKQMAVTNADGEFEFVVPANAGALQALVTYAGYADEPMTLNAAAESTVSLTNARVIVVARKQQLKNYLKTARKQVKHDLKQIHR